MARVTRHQRPHVGAVGSAGTGKARGAHLGQRGRGHAGGPAAGDAEPDQSHPVGRRPRPARASRPSSSSAPPQMKRAVATICQTMFWKASSPAIQAQAKLRTVKGSRRIGR